MVIPLSPNFYTAEHPCARLNPAGELCTPWSPQWQNGKPWKLSPPVTLTMTAQSEQPVRENTSEEIAKHSPHSLAVANEAFGVEYQHLETPVELSIVS